MCTTRLALKCFEMKMHYFGFETLRLMNLYDIKFLF